MHLGKERLCLTGQELGLYSFYRFHQLRDKEIIRYLDSWSGTEDLDSFTAKEQIDKFIDWGARSTPQ